MRYSLRTALAVVVALTAVAVGQELPSPDSRAVVEALLKRSRELDAVRFCVPQALWKQYLREQKGDPSPAGAPVPWIAQAGVYRLTAGESGKGVLEATVRIRVFDAAAAKNLAVLSAARAWKNLTLAAGGREAVPVELPANDGFLRFSPPAAGVFILKGLTDVTGDHVLLEVPATVVTSFEFAGPPGVEGRIEGREDVIPALAGKPTAGALALAPCNRFTISYGPPPVAFERSPRYQLQGTVAWNLDADVQHVTADLGVDVLVGRSDRIDLALPDGADRVRITGPEVREVQGASVFFRGRLRGQVRLNMEFDLRYGPGASRTLSGLGLREGRWTGGTLLVAGGGGEDEILPERAEGLTERTLTDLPPQAKAMLRGQPVAAYGITGSAWSASVEALKLGQFAMRESIADLAHYQVALQGDGAMMCKAQYEIRNRSQQFLRLALPAGATVLLARVNEKAQPLVPLPERPGVFVLPLVRSDATVKGLVTFPVEIVYMVRTAPLAHRGTARLPLPTLDIPVAYAWGEAYVPAGLVVSRWAGPMQQVEQFSSETAVASLGYGAGELAAGYKAEGRIHADPVGGKKPAPAKGAKESLGRPSVVTTEETPKGKPTSGAGRTPEVVGKGEGKGTKTKGGTADVAGKQGSETVKPKDVDEKDAYAYTLGRNYWRTGQEYYQQGNYESAEKALRKVTELAPGSQDATNASRLLSNIDVVRGRAKLSGAQEKAAGKGVQQEAAQQRQDLSRQQSEQLARGFEALKAGDRAKAQVQFQAAQAYNKKLLDQGETSKEQDALLAKARQEMQATAAAEQTRARELIAQAKQLEQKKDYAQALTLAKVARQRLKANEFGIDPNANASISGDARQAGELVEKLTVAAAQKAEVGAQHRLADDRVKEVAPGRTADSLKQMESLGYVGGSTQPAGRDRPVATRPAAPVVSGGTSGITMAEKDWKSAEPSMPDKHYGGGSPVSDTVLDASQARGDMAAARIRGASVTHKDKIRNVLQQQLPDEVRRMARGEEARRERLGELTRQAKSLLADDLQEAAAGVLAEIVRLDPQNQWAAQELNKARPVLEFRLRGRGPEDSNETMMGTRWGGSLEKQPAPAEPDATSPRGGESELAYSYDWQEKTVRRKANLTGKSAPAEPVVERTYDIQDMLVNVPNFIGPRTDVSRLGQNVQDSTSGLFGDSGDPNARHAIDGKEERKQAAAKVAQTIQSSVAADSWRELERAGGGLQIANGRLVVRQTEANQRKIAALLGELREARGARVQEGEKLLTQRANNIGPKLDVEYKVLDAGAMLNINTAWDRNATANYIDGQNAPAAAGRDAQALANDPEFQKFVGDNYRWATDGRRVGGQTPASAPALTAYDNNDLAQRLRVNNDQKTHVASWNVKVDEASAARLGLKFQAGNNGVRYTVVDEAQLRTLAELEASRGAGAAQVARNTRRQDTIVGTDALLANGMTANASFAADRGNVLDVYENTVAVPHERYLVVSNGGYLTAVRSLPMANWKEASPYVEVIEAPQKIDIPRVGECVRFEKKLAGADEALELSVTYEWKGAHE